MPARDEALTIADNVAAARACTYVRDVIVVDDGSTDDTAALAREAGAKVIQREAGESGSKAHAMDVGIRASDADAFLFVDADCTDLTGAHLDAICKPFLERRCEMSLGMFDYGRLWNSVVPRVHPLTGERIIPRWVWDAIPPHKLDGYTIEARINEVISERRLKTVARTMRGVFHRTKRVKHGRLEGVLRTLDMYREIISMVWPIGDIRWRTYWFYVRGLTVEH
ncbi:MAG TPA: glycosyltransferase [Acidimicrobiales bacterium]|nr:glycosyltransferase [Acidimicrobiales bacterium]